MVGRGRRRGLGRRRPRRRRWCACFRRDFLRTSSHIAASTARAAQLDRHSLHSHVRRRSLPSTSPPRRRLRLGLGLGLRLSLVGLASSPAPFVGHNGPGLLRRRSDCRGRGGFDGCCWASSLGPAGVGGDLVVGGFRARPAQHCPGQESRVPSRPLSLVFLREDARRAKPVSLGNDGNSDTLRVVDGVATVTADEVSSRVAPPARLAAQNSDT